jgi:hypothetical protein
MSIFKGAARQTTTKKQTLLLDVKLSLTKVQFHVSDKELLTNKKHYWARAIIKRGKNSHKTQAYLGENMRLS